MPHRLGLRTMLLRDHRSSTSALRQPATRTSSRAPRPRSRRPTSSSTCRPSRRSTCRPRRPMARTRSRSCGSRARSCSRRDVTVHGFITWAYDCATAIRKPDENDKDLQKRIDEDPTLCERPKFYIGDTKETPVEKSLWVVDVPRPYNKLEMERIKKPDRNRARSLRARTRRIRRRTSARRTRSATRSRSPARSRCRRRTASATPTASSSTRR